MNLIVRTVGRIWTVPSLLVVTLGGSLAWSQATNSTSATSTGASGWQWSNVSVDLPTSETPFPPGDGAELTAQCLICHSSGMVLKQPPLTRDQWVSEINKMRSAYGAPLPADQVDRLADYLFRINGSSPSRTAAHDRGG
jgi:ABC-type transport system substrate-binding protein